MRRLDGFRHVFIWGAILLLSCAAGVALAWGADGESTAGVDIRELKILDLKTAQKIAIDGNPTIQAATARVEQARERLVQARAAYWPRLDASGSASRNKLSENDRQSRLAQTRLFTPNATIDDPQDHYTAGLSASWVIFDGLARKFNNDAAKLGIEQNEQGRDDVKRILISNVASTYFAAQLAREDHDIAAADEAFNERQLLEAVARRTAGTGSLSDELNFRIRVNSAKTLRLRARQSYDAALFSLAALMGLSDTRFPGDMKLAKLAPEKPREMAPPEVTGAVAYAKRNRPDIVTRRLAVEQARIDQQVARSKFYPSLNLIAAYEGDRADDMAFEGDDFGNTVALNLTYNLFAGGYDRSRIREAKDRETESEKLLEDALNNLDAKIQSAATQVEAVQEQVALQRDNVVLVEQTRDLVEKEYAAGQGSLVRLNEAQRDLTTARSRLALALVSLRQAWVDFFTLTGEILLNYEQF